LAESVQLLVREEVGVAGGDCSLLGHLLRAYPHGSSLLPALVVVRTERGFEVAWALNDDGRLHYEGSRIIVTTSLARRVDTGSA
jgi:hypothetical protein